MTLVGGSVEGTASCPPHALASRPRHSRRGRGRRGEPCEARLARPRRSGPGTVSGHDARSKPAGPAGRARRGRTTASPTRAGPAPCPQRRRPVRPWPVPRVSLMGATSGTPGRRRPAVRSLLRNKPASMSRKACSKAIMSPAVREAATRCAASAMAPVPASRAASWISVELGAQIALGQPAGRPCRSPPCGIGRRPRSGATSLVPLLPPVEPSNRSRGQHHGEHSTGRVPPTACPSPSASRPSPPAPPRSPPVPRTPGTPYQRGSRWWALEDLNL